MKIRLISSIIIAMLLITGISASTLAADSGKATIPVPSVKTTDQGLVQSQADQEILVDNIELTIYENFDMGIKMLVPKDWKVVTGGSEVQFIPNNGEKVYLGLSINRDVFDILSQNGIDHGIKILSQSCQNIVPSYRCLETKKITTYGIPAVELTETFSQNNNAFKESERLVLKDGLCFDMDYQADTNVFDKYKNVITKCFDSYQILPIASDVKVLV